MSFRPCIPRPVWLLLLSVGLSLPARGQQVHIHTSSDSVRIGERFFLSLTTEHDPTTQVAFPDPARGDTAFGDVVLLRKLPIHTRSIAGGLQIDSLVYEAAAFGVDTALVSPIPVQFSVDEQVSTVTSPPLGIPIISSVGSEAQNIKDLAPIVPFAWAWWGWPLLVLVVLVGILAWWRLVRDVLRSKQRQIAPTEVISSSSRSPLEEAEERLHRLQETYLGAPQLIKPFYVELSDVVRTYLRRRLDIPALEETSRELIADLYRLAPRHNISPRTVGLIEQVLEAADLVKFADQRPPAATSQALVEEADRAVHEIETTLRQDEASVPLTPVSN